MKRRSFKMRVVESTATLVLSIIAAALLWCLTGVNNLLNWAGFLLALLAMLAVAVVPTVSVPVMLWACACDS